MAIVVDVYTHNNIIIIIFPGHSISSETEEFIIRVPISRPLGRHLNSDQEVNTDTDTDLTTMYYRDDIHTHSQRQRLRTL